MSRNKQQPTCINAAYGNLRITIKHRLQDCPQWREERKKHGMEGNVEKTLGKECEMAKLMRFLKEINVYEDI